MLSTSAATTEPLFDSSRKALAFALNGTRTRYAAPLMSKMMSEIKAAEKPQKIKRRRNPDVPGEWIITRAVEPAVTRAHRQGGSLRGLDAAAQAGMVLMHYAKLDGMQQAALACSVLQAESPCHCRSPCCQGFRMNEAFSDACESIVKHLAIEQEHRRKPGTRTVVDRSGLWKALVAEHYGVERLSLLNMAALHGCTRQTALVHRERLRRLITEAEKDGWSRLDGLLVQAGIVGSLQT